MAKQGKHNFELKKGKRFQFNLSKNPKRTFDLVKDEDEATVASKALQHTIDPATNSTETTTEDRTPESPFTTPSTKGNTNDESKDNGNVDNNKWMWIVVAILIVAIIAWLCVRSCSSSNDNGVLTEPSIETTQGTGASEEGFAGEDNSTDVEVEQVATSDIEKESPVVEEATEESTATSSETPSDATAIPSSTLTTESNETASRPSVDTKSAVSSVPSTEVTSDIEAEALKVIKGEYGTGIERKLKLGSKYQEIQKRVNELKRQGAF